MASKPIISAGLDIPNCTFSIPPDSENGLAAGWTQSGGTSTWSMYGASVAGRRGHDRLQYFFVTSQQTTPITLLSAPCSPRLFCANATTTAYLAMVVGLTGSGAAAGSVTAYLAWYNSAGTLLDTQSLGGPSGALALGLYTTTASVTPPANAYVCRVRLDIGKSTGTTGLYVALGFVGVGCWNGTTASYYQWTRYPSLQGTVAAPTTQANRVERGDGSTVLIDRKRHGHPYSFTFAVDALPDADAQVMERAWRINTGRSSELNATTNPTGGSYPLILLPGRDDMPAAALVDFADAGRYPLAQTSAILTTPLWSGVMNFNERL